MFRLSFACLFSLPVFLSASSPRLFLLGDSTTSNWYDPRIFRPVTGWGTHLSCFTQPGREVFNYARGGHSLRLLCQKSYGVPALYKNVRKGDFVTLQFGHNDQFEKVEDKIGDFKQHLLSVIDGLQQRGANPVLVTPVPRFKLGPDGKLVNTLADFPQTIRDVAKEKNLPLIDFNAILTEEFNKMGEEKLSREIYATDKAVNYRTGKRGFDREHFFYPGSLFICRTFIREVKRQNLPFADMFRNEMYITDFQQFIYKDRVIIAWNEHDIPEGCEVRVLRSASPYVEMFMKRSAVMAKLAPKSAGAVFAKEPALVKVLAPNGHPLTCFDGIAVAPRTICGDKECFFAVTVGKGAWVSIPSAPWSAQNYGLFAADAVK